MNFKKFALVFSISLIFGGIENLCLSMGFRSDKLEEISKYISVDKLHDDSVYTVSYENHDVNIRISNGRVEHIGYRIFPNQIRTELVIPAVADFIERYWLSLTLPITREKSPDQQMVEDRFVFQTGSLKSINLLQQDSTLAFSCKFDPSQVNLLWEKNEKPICSITFPVNHELILGRRMLENDRRLPDEIESMRIKEPSTKIVNRNPTLSLDSITHLWKESPKYYIDNNLVNQRYYTKGEDGTSFEPVFDSNLYVESITNMFTGYDIAKTRDIPLSIRHQTFGLTEQPIETNIHQFVMFALQTGCIPYVGILSIDKDNSGVADILVIMHNEQVGYNHILRASVPLQSISEGIGTATARLNAYVPCSNIKNLFKN